MRLKQKETFKSYRYVKLNSSTSVPVVQWLEHCVSSVKGCGFNSQGIHTDKKIYNLLCKSLWIKVSDTY